MKYLFYNRHFFLCLLCMIFSSCSWFSLYEDVCFSLPENGTWKIYVSNGEEFVAEGKEIVLRIIKNEPLAVIARPENSLKSYGAIYPFNDELKEEFSFPAQVLYSLSLSSVNPENVKMHLLSTFNWRKFEEACMELGDSIWLVNKEILMKKIAAGTFKKSDLKIEKTN